MSPVFSPRGAGPRDAATSERKKWARADDPRPRIVEAYLYFHEELTEFFKGAGDQLPLQHEVPLADRLDECLKALKGALQVVAIDLEQEDDAQVIFETLMRAYSRAR